VPLPLEETQIVH
jgi:hypothetical protein